MMDEQKAAAALADAQQYREIAHKLRGIAQECHFLGGRQELLDLAGRYEGTANHLDPRTPFFSRTKRSRPSDAD